LRIHPRGEKRRHDQQHDQREAPAEEYPACVCRIDHLLPPKTALLPQNSDVSLQNALEPA
jgi:hypothetical protein